ncbi:MAG: hypothetical protein U0804_25020 [Gemmataceae bacterium]
MTRYLTGLFADAPAGGYTYTGGDPAHTTGDPMIGWLIVAGVIAVAVLVAWVVARVGDLDSVSDKP